MFCPECGAEYREGFYECADCQVPLTVEPPSHVGEPTVEVFRSADAALLPVVKSVRVAAGIPFSVQGDESSGLFPLGNTTSASDGRGLGALIRVPESRAGEARELLESTAPDDEGESE